MGAATYLPCNRDGTILFSRKSDNAIIIDSNSDNSEDIKFVDDTDRTRETKSIKMELENMATLFKDTNATNAILPQDDVEHFFTRPVKAAYWALHMVGITDKWKPYKKQEKRENIQDLERALECVKEKQPNFQYMEINTKDYGKHGRLFADLDRTPRTEIPGNLDVNKLWIVFRIIYGKFAIRDGKRTGFQPDGTLGYALYRNAVIIGGTEHMYHVSKRWL